MDTSARREAAGLIILDLEWNGTHNRRLKGYINKIVESGAVKVDETLMVVDTFHVFAHPQVGKKTSGKIRTPARLSSEDLMDGMLFMQVVSRLRK